MISTGSSTVGVSPLTFGLPSSRATGSSGAGYAGRGWILSFNSCSMRRSPSGGSPLHAVDGHPMHITHTVLAFLTSSHAHTVVHVPPVYEDAVCRCAPAPRAGLTGCSGMCATVTHVSVEPTECQIVKCLGWVEYNRRRLEVWWTGPRGRRLKVWLTGPRSRWGLQVVLSMPYTSLPRGAVTGSACMDDTCTAAVVASAMCRPGSCLACVATGRPAHACSYTMHEERVQQGGGGQCALPQCSQTNHRCVSGSSCSHP